MRVKFIIVFPYSVREILLESLYIFTLLSLVSIPSQK
nr:MAG TPA: hypothetical protein [Caudoviricetes sp.]